MLKSVFSILAVAVIHSAAAATAQQTADKDAKVMEALRAAPSRVAAQATVKDWDGTVLRPGKSAWTCYPSPATMPNTPMCLDSVWEQWAPAWMNKKPFKTDKVGMAYMLMGDSGSSNIDPYATKPSADNEWVVEGPHLMILVPDAKMLEGLPDDPKAGGPYVMWKGTPYAHIMVPVR